MQLLKQSTAFTFRLGPFVDSTDGYTAMTALTIAQADIQISKNGGAFAQTSAASPTTTHDADGWYQLPLTTTDTNTLGHITVKVRKSGALPVWKEYMVVPANVYDSLVGGTDVLDVSATQFAGQTITAAAGVTIPSSIASPTNITAGTITTVTNLTNAPTAGDFTATMKTSIGTAVAASAVASVTGNVGGNVTGSVGSVATGGITATSIAADAIGASELAADAVTEIAAGVWAAAARTLTAGTNIELAKGTGITGFNDLDASGVRAAVGLASANLDTQIGTLATTSGLATVAGYVDTEVASIKTVTDKLDTAMELDTGAYRFTVAALAQAPSGTGASAASIRAEIDANSTQLAGIRAKTDNLPADPADASDIAASFSTVNSTLATIAGYVDTEVAAIKAKTDLIPAAPAAVGDIPTAATIADAVWDEVVDGTTTGRQSMRLHNSVLGGEVSGAEGTTVTIRDLADTKARLTVTVDADGNRSSVTRDLT